MSTKPLPDTIKPGTYGSGIYPEGPIYWVDDALPWDTWRYRVFYEDGSHEHAVCNQGRWWTVHGEVFPILWQTMGNESLRSG